MGYKNGFPVDSSDFEDERFKIKDDIDPSKALRFDLSGISHATTVVIKIPPTGGTICTEEVEKVARIAADSSLSSPTDLIIAENLVTTTSTSDTLLSSMAITPTTTGTLRIRGYALVACTTNGGTVTVSLYVQGVKVANTSQAAATAGSRYCGVVVTAKIPYTTGAVELRWKVSAGTGRALGRSLEWEKVNS